MSFRDRTERGDGLILQHKDAFCLRDVIGTCLNIEVEVNVTVIFLFFIRPYHGKEDKVIFDK